MGGLILIVLLFILISFSSPYLTEISYQHDVYSLQSNLSSETSLGKIVIKDGTKEDYIQRENK